jgi:hypothetical protein
MIEKPEPQKEEKKIEEIKQAPSRTPRNRSRPAQ